MHYVDLLRTRARVCTCWLMALAALAALTSCGEDTTVGAGNSATDTATSTSDVPVGGGDGSTGGGNKPCVTSADCLPVVEPCRAASCQPNVGCVTVILSDGAVCEDGNACTVSGLCKQGACVAGAPVDCNDNDACSADSCDPKTGCSHAPAADGSACSDGNPCTADDVCKSGSCTAGANVCGCKTDDDCAAKEDGNACNGTLYCDKSDPKAPKCSVNPASVVHCPASFDTPCLKNACQPKDGSCVPVPIEGAKQLCVGSVCDWLVKNSSDPAGTFFVCDDGDPCTTVDHCQSGQCLAGSNNLCGCKSDAECAGQDDGNLCNGTLFCNKALSPAACQLNPATVVSCPSVDDTTCAKNECNPKSGACVMVPAGDGKACDDGNPCTTGDSCQKGQCAAAANTCICKTDADCAGKDDGDLCNGTMFCDKPTGSCKINPATVVVCPSVDDTVCSKNVCQSKTGQCAMVAASDGAPCDDQNPCTANDHCDKGQCAATANTCACGSDADCASKDDGDLCNGTLYCKAGTCQLNPATVVSCSSSFDTACLQNQCDKKSGTCAMHPVNQGLPCSDGNPCTAAETCHLGECKSESNLCECQNNADCAAKDDGNFCNGTLFCDKSSAPYVCAVNPATVVACKSVDDTFCVANQCQPKTGLCEMTAVHQGLGCTDNNPCTTSDACKNGACQGQMADCQDDQDCTVDQCDPVLGCINKADPGKCNDENPCTVDSCNVVAGCLHKLTIGPCDDGNACTSGDTCDGTTCAGKASSCDDKNPCTTDSCVPTTGCAHAPNTLPCDTGLACTPIGTCEAGACVAGPSPLFTVLLDGKAEDQLAAVLASDLGSVTAVGSTTSQGKGQHDVWLARTSAGGSVLGQNTVGTSADEWALGAVASPSGGGLAVGRLTPGPSGGSDGYLVRYGADLQAQWKQVAGGSGDDELRAAAWLPGGDAVAVGKRGGTPGTMGGGTWWAVRVSAVGTALWEKDLGIAGSARAVAVGEGDKIFVVGTVTQTDGTSRLGAALIGPTGGIVWQKALATAPGGAEAVAVLPGGDVAVGGWQGADFDDARLVRLNGDTGAVVYDLLYGGAGTGVFSALSLRTDGTLAFAGRRGTDGGPQLWLGRIDLLGKLVWDRMAGATLATELPALAVLAGDENVLAGTWQASDTQGLAGRVIRTDAWGYASCTDEGDCAGKKASDCNDNNPCTHDLCQAVLGCSHQVNALPCDDGNACTTQDTCDQGQCAKSSSGSCDDKNACTTDVCDSEGGCSHSPASGACDDGNVCTKGDTCALGLCKPGVFDTCDDGNSCSDDTCDAKKGCAHTLNSSPCQSGNCTYGDVCSGGFCASSGKPAFLDKWFGGAFNDRAQSLEQVGEDGFVLGGETYPTAHPDGLITRVDAQGNKLWDATIVHAANAGDDYVRSVVPTPFGFMAAGYTNNCSYRGLLARLDPDGKVKWVKARSPSLPGDGDCWDGHERGVFFDLVDGGDGSFVAVGWRTHASWNETRGWLNRVDQDGNTMNNQYYLNGPGQTSSLQGVERASGGGYIVAGYTNVATAGGWDGLLIRTDGAGTQQWWAHYGGKGNDVLTDAVPAPDGGFYAFGYTASIGAGLEDGWIIRVSQTGALLWQKTYGGTASDSWSAGRLLPGGTLVVSGATLSSGAGGQDAWLAGLDGQGNLQWQKTVGSAADDVWSDVRVLKSGGYALAGYGYQPKATQQDMRLLLTDAFGHLTCADAGSCFASVSADCDDKNLCTADSCSPQSGCTHTNATWACSDGDACTSGEVCAQGKCGGGDKVLCDDGNPCTTDSCDPGSGCGATKVPDGTACGTGKACAAGVCK